MKPTIVLKPLKISLQAILLVALFCVHFAGSSAHNASALQSFALTCTNNDDFDCATSFSSLPYISTLDTTTATTAVDDPQVNSACDGRFLAKGNKTVWYAYVPSTTGIVSMDTLGSSYDTYIAIWTGSRGSLSLAACDDDNAGGLQSDLVFNVTAGSTYYVEVAQYNGIQGGTPQTPTGGTLKFHVGISWVGGVSLTSDQNVVTIGRPEINNEVMAYSGFGTGATTMYVPMLFRRAFGGTYNAALYVQNLDAVTTANVSIAYYDTSGNLTCTVNDTISTLSSRGYWTPQVGCLSDGWVGGAVITSNTNIVAIGRPHIGEQIMTYNGFAAGATSMYVPMLFRRGFNGTYNAALYVQNVSSDSASITIDYYDSSGNFTCTMNDTIPALASHGYWTPQVGCLPDGWVGSAVIAANRNIVALGRPHIADQITTYDGFAGGSLSTYVPMMYRRAVDGTYNAALYIQNLDTVNTANVAIKYYDTAGNLTCTVNDTIAKLSSKGYWTPQVGCLSDGWEGEVIVTADRNIVAIGRPHFGGEIFTYDGFVTGGSGAYVPMLFSNGFDGTYDSALHIQNIHATNNANITLKFYDTNGTLNCTKTDTIGPLATVDYWIPDTVSGCVP